MLKFYNPHQHSVELIGQNGERVVLKSKTSKMLPEYYKKYVKNNFIKLLSLTESKTTQNARTNSTTTNVTQETTKYPIIDVAGNISRNRIGIKFITPRYNRNKKEIRTQPELNKIVGKNSNINPNDILRNKMDIRISNGVGVGILSYNRGESLERCVESLKKFTNLNSTSIFISDDGSTDPKTINILDNISKDKRIVVLRNEKNVGISSNSNRLLRCLRRFDHIFMCNDDVEFLCDGWDRFYIDKSVKSGLQHLCFRQAGIYGAGRLKPTKINNVDITLVHDKPHGSFLYVSNECLQNIGFFNSNYKQYGMEHVDWSMKPHEFGIQPSGFFDFFGSDRYIKTHDEPTSCNDKTVFLKENRQKFKLRTECQKLEPCDESSLPSISYIIPCRLVDRMESIKTVVSCVIGQSFPVINIYIVEQDSINNLSNIKNINYIWSKNRNSELFNKSQAFNVGVSKSSDDFVVLHDADMLISCDYTSSIYEMLKKKESVHISSHVLYLNKDSTNRININKLFSSDLSYERVVDYFEGGSLACRRSTYWDVGGFNEDFKGYGVEDCDFYYRLSNSSDFVRLDNYALIHLWHSRQDGWSAHHKENKILGSNLDSMTLEQRIRLQKNKLKYLGFT